MQESVFEAMRGYGAPVTARWLAASLGVHVTTARYHLDRLVSAGAVVRTAHAPKGMRGRPELTYALVDADSARDSLIVLLADLVDSGTGPEGALAAGRAWADAIPDVTGDAPETIERVLAVRGFAPERTESGFDLHGCPFRDAALRSPRVVCALHLGLTQRLADRADGVGTWSVDLEPFVDPTLCRIALSAGSAA